MGERETLELEGKPTAKEREIVDRGKEKELREAENQENGKPEKEGNLRQKKNHE